MILPQKYWVFANTYGKCLSEMKNAVHLELSILVVIRLFESWNAEAGGFVKLFMYLPKIFLLNVYLECYFSTTIDQNFAEGFLSTNYWSSALAQTEGLKNERTRLKGWQKNQELIFKIFAFEH